MAEDTDGVEIAAAESTYRKGIPLSTKWMITILLALIIAAFAIGPVSRLINGLIEGARAATFSKQLFNAKLPEKTDIIEEIYYGDEQDNKEFDAFLLIKSDLSLNAISDYYESMKFTPIRKGDVISINVHDQLYFLQWFGLDSTIKLFEDVAAQNFGAYHIMHSNSSYGNVYFICVGEEAP